MEEKKVERRSGFKYLLCDLTKFEGLNVIKIDKGFNVLAGSSS